MAFVNFLPDNETQSGSTDIDGKFKLSLEHPAKQLVFSYVGYEPYTLLLSDSVTALQELIVYLKQKQVLLQEAIVVAGENPAYRILKRVTENKDKNDPEKIHSFSYTSYNKIIFTLNSDSIARRDSVLSISKNPKDTAAQRRVKKTKELVEKQYLFMMESVSSRNYLSPDKNNETVLASRVSGFQDPSFILLATELQSFSFYKNDITIFEKEYLNPISKGSLTKYSYLIEDTTYSDKDTVFIISFRPIRNKNFDGLKGVLYINTNGYAIQNVIAEPAADQEVQVKIQQKYEFVEGKQWFPTQLNTDIVFKNSSVNSFAPLGIGRSYLKDILINPDLNKKQFGRIELKVADDATKKTNDYWNKYRTDTLSEKEKNTYHKMDSIGKAEKFDRKLKIVETLISGKIPVRQIDFDINRFLDYNRHEGIRAGAGLHTNDKISHYFSVGGYGAYGFEDKVFKYGADLILKPFHDPAMQFGATYINDVIESGGVSFFDDQKILSPENYRKLYVNIMDKIEKKEFSFVFRAFQYVKINAFVNQQQRTVTPDNNYRYGEIKNQQAVLSRQFNFTEAGIALRYAYRERFISTSRTQISEGTKYPILWLNISKGFKDILNGEFDYIKVDGKIEKDFFIRSLGRPSIQLNFGMVQGKVPYTLLNSGKGSFIPFALSAPNSFETMGYNEFLSNRYAFLFFSHNFGSRLFHIKKFRPRISVVSKVGFGQLSTSENHYNIPVKTMEKGYYESGVVFDNLLKINFTRLGVGCFYRYGPYANSSFDENIAMKITFGIIL
ncbi:MAG: hypothetical protein IT235_09000 [Bacteroidia bacterium]|nr:hypothetical protein [Bacteroidia bacterium]